MRFAIILTFVIAAILSPAYSQDNYFALGPSMTMSDEQASGFDGSPALGLSLGSEYSFGYLQTTFDGILDSRVKWWREDERSNPYSWDADLQLSTNYLQLSPTLGFCSLGWNSSGLNEGKSDSGLCYGLRWYTEAYDMDWSIRATYAEFETYGAESSQRFDVESYRLLLKAGWNKWDALMLVGAGDSEISRMAFAMRYIFGSGNK